jgi:hypothetical protein
MDHPLVVEHQDLAVAVALILANFRRHLESVRPFFLVELEVQELLF